METHRSTSPMTMSVEPMMAIDVGDQAAGDQLRAAPGSARNDGGARLDAPRPVGAVRHHVEPLLAARALDRHVRLAGRHREALRVDQEVLDERFHLRVDLVLGRRHDARVVDAPDAGRRDPRDGLLADLARSRASRRRACGSARRRRRPPACRPRSRSSGTSGTGTPGARRRRRPTRAPSARRRPAVEDVLPGQDADALGARRRSSSWSAGPRTRPSSRGSGRGSR